MGSGEFSGLDKLSPGEIRRSPAQKGSPVIVKYLLYTYWKLLKYPQI